MSESKETIQVQQVMDLRDVFFLIWGSRWWIIGITLLAMAAAIISSAFLVTPSYTSSAYITFTEPIINTEFESSIQISPTMPDTQAMAELVGSEEILRLVVSRLELEDYYEDKLPEMEAALRGKSQLRLTATDQDRTIAANLANTWAEVISERLNQVYGSGQLNQTSLESEVEAARLNWMDAQADLEEFLPSSRVAILEVELHQLKNKLSRYFNRIENNTVLIEDAVSLDSRLSELNPAQFLPLEDALSLIALHQRVSGEISGAEILIQDTSISSEYTVFAAKASVTSLISSLHAQNETLAGIILTIQSDIAEVTVALENEQFKLEQLTQERDLAKSSYVALSNQLEENRITETQNGSLAKISSPAVVADKPSGNSVLVNTILAGAAGFGLSVLAVMVVNWWGSNDD